MKKTLTIIILVIGICTASHAQYAAGHRTLFRESGNLYTSEGIPLDITTAEELLSPDAFRQYRTGKGLFISGIAVSATGGAFFLGGTASIIAGVTLLGKERSSCSPPGLPFIFAGYRRSSGRTQHPALLHRHQPTEQSCPQHPGPGPRIRPAAVPWGAAKRHRAGHTVLTESPGAPPRLPSRRERSYSRKGNSGRINKTLHQVRVMERGGRLKVQDLDILLHQ